jgi:hypothetical protein
MKHKHHEAIKAFADGKRCSWWDNVNQRWHQIRGLQEFDWCEIVQVDPEPKPDVVTYLYRALNGFEWFDATHVYDDPVLKLTWDSEKKKLKNAEVIK